MFKVMLISIAIVILVLVLTIYSISKGYAYNHKVDPLPDKKNNKAKKSDQNDQT